MGRMRDNLRDVRIFGPSVLLRHSPRLTGTAKVSIPKFGKIHLRPGQSDIAVVRQIFGDKEYDTEHLAEPNRRIWHRYREILAAGNIPIIVDAGANIGAASIWFRTKYPGAHVVAIEPDPGNVEILLLNSADDREISVIAGAVGATNGFAALQEEKFGWATRTKRAAEGMPVVSMNEAFSANEVRIPFIAKIDIEGFEADLFSRNLEWLEQVCLVIIEPHDWMLPGKKTSRPFQVAMAKHEFEVFIHGENLFYLKV
jgi:FkbM family methyltransferase